MFVIRKVKGGSVLDIMGSNISCFFYCIGKNSYLLLFSFIETDISLKVVMIYKF